MLCSHADIEVAVIPAAGRGTRLHPLTTTYAKEMLPLGRQPAVQYVVEELRATGIRDIIFVVAPWKDSIRGYFGDRAGDGRTAFRYAIQHPQNGLADAILQAEAMVDGRSFVVALGDTVIVSGDSRPPMRRLVDCFVQCDASACVGVERVALSTAYMFGMVSPVGDVNGESFAIDGLVEKPRPDDAPSDFAIGGRYVFSPDVFEWIRSTRPGVGGEQQITDSIGVGIESGSAVRCVPLQEGEKRFDIGDFGTYTEAFTTACMMDPELRDSVLRAARS